jgi:hypothetical protein
MSANEYQLILPHAIWRAAVMPLLTGAATLAAGPLRRDPTRTPLGLIVDQLRLDAPATGNDQAPIADWLVLTTRDLPHAPDAWRQLLRPWRSQALVVLVVGLGSDSAGWRGWVFEHGEIRPLAGFRIVGPGMVSVGTDLSETPPDDETWSRLQHAVGLRTFAKLRQASVGIVGASRLGSQVAFQCSSLGVRRLVLVDSDLIENHNVVGMPSIQAAYAGQPKVTALAATLTAFRPDLAVTALAQPLAKAQDRLRDLGLLVTTVDNDGPRLLAAHWTRRHAVVHLDIGTGVTQQDTERLVATYVRLFIPGMGCIRCVGGLGDLDQAEYELHTSPGALPRRPPEAWNARGRLGSLPTLNAMAAATGVQLWLDLLDGTLTASTWHRLRWHPGTGWERASSLARAGEGCPLCQTALRRAA